MASVDRTLAAILARISTPDRTQDPKLAVRAWRGDVLILMPPQATYSVWWLFEEGTFAGWYVTLEEPYIVVTPHRQWQWKDAEEFDRRIGHPLYFDRATAAVIRGEGDRAGQVD